MKDGDEDLIELIERRLAESVEERVRSRLFKVYAAMGAVVLAVLGFIGFDAVGELKSMTKSEVDDIVQPLVADSKASLDEARISLGVAREHLVNIAKNSADYDREVGELQGQLRSVQEEMAHASKDIQNQRQRAADLYAGAGSLAELARNVEALTKQVQALDEQVREIAQRTDVDTASKGASSVELDTLVDMVQRQAVATPTERPTVFFQYAGISREEARRIARALSDREYNVPGEDHEESARRLHQVRYYFEDDKEAASRLARDTERIVAQLGFGKVEVSLKSMLGYSGSKPRQGVLELWLGLQPPG